MSRFSANRGYPGVDLAHVITHRPTLCTRIMRETTELLVQGRIKPIRPIRAMDAVEIEQCFRSFQKGDHIGRIVVRLPVDVQELVVKPSKHTHATFEPNATYLLVGGLGGLGRAISLWMAQRGARHLPYLTRSGGKDVPEAFYRELNAIGCECSIIQGDVSDCTTVSELFRTSTRTIRGVMHMAMALNVRSLSYSPLSMNDD